MKNGSLLPQRLPLSCSGGAAAAVPSWPGADCIGAGTEESAGLETQPWSCHVPEHQTVFGTDPTSLGVDPTSLGVDPTLLGIEQLQ